MILPQIALGTASALQHAKSMTQTMTPNTARMRETLDASDGLIHAKPLSFALAEKMQRPQAQSEVKALCAEAQKTGASLQTLARAAHPDLSPDLFDPAATMGHAPDAARSFALRVQDI